MSVHRTRERVLALYPFTRGVSFTLFDAPLSLLDWGTCRVGAGEKNARSLAAAQRLLDRHQPDVLVLEAYVGNSIRRRQRIARLNQLIRNYADGQSIDVRIFERSDICMTFEPLGAGTRYEIARAIASRVPVLARRLPPVRKAWMSQDSRMTLFNAPSPQCR